MIVDLKNIFGYVGLPFPAGDINISPVVGIDNVLDRADLLGRPIQMPVRIAGVLIEHAILSISGRKTIVQTALAGSSLRGTVKELIGTDDYEINIVAVLVGENGEFPQDKLTEIRELFERSETLTIECALTHLFNVQKIVLTALDVNEVRWHEAQPISLRAISDDDFIVELLNEK